MALRRPPPLAGRRAMTSVELGTVVVFRLIAALGVGEGLGAAEADEARGDQKLGHGVLRWVRRRIGDEATLSLLRNILNLYRDIFDYILHHASDTRGSSSLARG